MDGEGQRESRCPVVSHVSHVSRVSRGLPWSSVVSRECPGVVGSQAMVYTSVHLPATLHWNPVTWAQNEALRRVWFQCTRSQVLRPSHSILNFNFT